MPSLWIASRAAVIYIFVAATGMAYVFQLTQTPLVSTGIITRFLWVELSLTAICLYYVWRYFGWAAVGFGRVNWLAVGWLLPSYVVVIAMFAGLWPKLTDPAFFAAHRDALIWLTLTTFLIGFSEEVMFRGILLRSALARLAPIRAMLLSAFAFSMLHVANGFGGQPLSFMIHQLAFSFLIGFFLAPVAVRIGNLWPLIIWHWMWDFAVFGSAMADHLQPFALIGMLFQVLLGLYLWSQFARD